MLCLASFIPCNGFEIHPSYCMYQQFVLFFFFCPELNSSEWIYYGLPIHYLIDEHNLGCFQSFAIMNQAAMGIGSFTSLLMDMGTVGSWLCLGVELLSLMANVC